MNDWMTEWLNDWMNEWLSEWVNEWLNVCKIEERLSSLFKLKLCQIQRTQIETLLRTQKRNLVVLNFDRKRILFNKFTATAVFKFELKKTQVA